MVASLKTPIKGTCSLKVTCKNNNFPTKEGKIIIENIE